MALAGEARRPDALEAGQLTLATDEVAAGGPSGGGGERERATVRAVPAFATPRRARVVRRRPPVPPMP